VKLFGLKTLDRFEMTNFMDAPNKHMQTSYQNFMLALFHLIQISRPYRSIQPMMKKPRELD
jgi:hypothetical protein